MIKNYPVITMIPMIIITIQQRPTTPRTVVAETYHVHLRDPIFIYGERQENSILGDKHFWLIILLYLLLVYALFLTCLSPSKSQMRKGCENAMKLDQHEPRGVGGGQLKIIYHRGKGVISWQSGFTCTVTSHNRFIPIRPTCQHKMAFFSHRRHNGTTFKYSK